MIVLRLTLCATFLMGSTMAFARDLAIIPAPNLEAQWLRLSYSRIRPTEYKFSNGKLTIQVDKSASPFLFPFEKPAKLKNIRLRGVLLEVPHLKSGKDDFILRVGPAIEGQRQLNAVQRMLAPKWISVLDDLARNKGRKLGYLDLSLVGLNSAAPSWKQRQHPDTDLINERFVLGMDGIGPFDLNLSYPETSPPSLGLWLGADGDNSEAHFSLRIDELLLQFYDDNE